MIDQTNDVHTHSSLSDQIEKVFSSVKREQPFFRLNVICGGDYYYFSFLNSIYNQKILEIKACDVQQVLSLYPDIKLNHLKKWIDIAIQNFAEKNGFGDKLDRMKKSGRYQWRIIL